MKKLLLALAIASVSLIPVSQAQPVNSVNCAALSGIPLMCLKNTTSYYVVAVQANTGYSFGPNWIRARTPVTNVRLSSFISCESEVRVLDPRLVDVEETVGCEVVSDYFADLILSSRAVYKALDLEARAILGD